MQSESGFKETDAVLNESHANGPISQNKNQPSSTIKLSQLHIGWRRRNKRAEPFGQLLGIKKTADRHQRFKGADSKNH